MSKAGSLDKEELKKVGKGLLIAMAGAGLTYIAQWLGGADFGTWTPIAAAVGGVIANFARKISTKN